MAFLGGTGARQQVATNGTKTSGFLGGGIPKPKTYTPLPYTLPTLGVGGVGKTTPMGTSEGDTARFLAEIVGAPLRSGLQIGLDVQNVATGNMPAPINPREEFGDYAAYFLGDQPINALSADYEAAIQGSGQNNATSNFINLLGTTAGAALNVFPVYGSLARKAAELGTRKFILKQVADLSGNEAVNVRRFYDLPVQGKSVLSPINVRTPYTPADQLPVIEYGKAGKSTTPTVSVPADEPFGVVTPKTPGLKYVPIGRGLEVPVRVSTPELKPFITPRRVPASTTGVVSKGAKDAKAIAAEAGMRALPEDSLARTTPMTFKSQENRIKFLLSDIDEAKRMADDPSRIPNDVQLPAFFNAMLAYAKRTRDWRLLADLSASRLASASTEAGRSLVSTKVYQDPAVRAIQEIGKVRETTFKGSPAKIKKAARLDVAREISKQPADWDSFIDEITC